MNDGWKCAGTGTCLVSLWSEVKADGGEEPLRELEIDERGCGG